MEESTEVLTKESFAKSAFRSVVKRIRKRPSQKGFEMVLLLVLGILVGFSVKTEAAKRITMGANDYMVTQRDVNAYDLNQVQKDLLAKGETGSVATPQAAGGLCSQ